MKDHSKPSNRHKPKERRPGNANRVRIIGGEWRSRIVEFPDSEGLRPTANRVRETLFNWLGQTLHGQRCLDLFAGSGALAFEAASRGASEVMMVENNPSALEALNANHAKLNARQCRIFPHHALSFLENNHEKFDVIFVDPPFASGLMAPLLGMLGTHLAEGGRIYVESAEQLSQLIAVFPPGTWHLIKQGKAGAVHFGLLTTGKGVT